MRFKTLVLIFHAALLLYTGLYFLLPLGVWPYYVLIALFFAGLAFGSANIRVGMYIQSLCRGTTQQKGIAITFDDGPSEYTPVVLDLLAAYKVKATFFCVGKAIEAYPQTVKRMHDEGHIIGNHSYSHHALFDFFSAKKMTAELLKTQRLIEKLISKKPRLFRPPYGVTNPALARAVGRMGYTSIGWSLRSFDTLKRKNEKVLNRLERRLKAGDIVLFHDNRENSPELLKSFIEMALAKQFEIKSLDLLLDIKAYHEH